MVFDQFSIVTFINKTLEYELPILNLEIFDTQSPLQPLFKNEDVRKATENSGLEELNFTVTDRTWQIRMLPKPNFVAYPHALEAYFTLIPGLSSTLLLVAVIWIHNRVKNNLQITRTMVRAFQRFRFFVHFRIWS